jgi:hypothetical protein
MSIEPRLSLVTLGVRDLAAARRFYEQGLGWPVSSASQGDVVFLAAGGVVLALFPRTALARDAGLPADAAREAEAGFSGVTLAQNVASPEAVTAALEIAQAAGGRIVKTAQTAEWGGFSGYFADPDGHLWEVAYNPFFPLDAKGAIVLP